MRYVVRWGGFYLTDSPMTTEKLEDAKQFKTEERARAARSECHERWRRYGRIVTVTQARKLDGRKRKEAP